jgi:predicted N-formylglutamate amidohydrolase
MPSRTSALAPGYRLHSARAVSRFVLTCEHANRRLPYPTPTDRRLRDLLRSHWGWDIGAWALTRELAPRLGSPAIGGRWSRLLIDLNRLVSEPSLIRREAGGLVLPWNRNLARAEIERRVLQVHAGYHNALDRLILRQLVRGISPAVIAIHTFTPEEFDGRSRRFDAGVLFANRERAAHRVGKTLREGGLRVRYNEPYSGLAGMMYSADRHGTHHGLYFLELEFNQVLFEEPANVARLARITATALRKIPRRNA